MLQLTPQSRIFVATEPVDFRKGIDGLAAVCRRALGDNPLSGALYVFRNRAGTTLKILCYDGQGFWLCTKRLSIRPPQLSETGRPEAFAPETPEALP
jgi:transposase